MKVNRNNYEVWMIDYFDGNLNADDISELLAFIDLNPDIKDEFEIFDGQGLKPDNIIFEPKKNLRKRPVQTFGSISEENYEAFFIAWYENDLDEPKIDEVNEFIKKNPQLEKEFNTHAELFLIADQSVTYPEKENLKKKRTVGIYWWAGTAAASIAILFGIFSLFQTNSIPTEREFLSANRIVSKSIETIVSEIPLPELAAWNEIVIDTPKFIEETETTKPGYLATIPSTSYNSDLVDINNYLTVKEYQLIDTDIALASNVEETEKKKGLLAKIFTNYTNRVSTRRAKREDKNQNDPGFVRFLDQSIIVFNTVTGSDTEMVKSYDNEGNLKNYQVEGETISWSKVYSSNQNSE